MLYRCAPGISNVRTQADLLAQARVCLEYRKTGLYFATIPIVSLGMCIEDRELKDLAVFEVVKPITRVMAGPNARKAFTDLPGFDVAVHPVAAAYNRSHQTCRVLVQKSKKKSDGLLPLERQYALNALGNCEIFLTPPDLGCIRLRASYRFADHVRSHAHLRSFMRKNDYPFQLEPYVDGGLLVLHRRTGRVPEQSPAYSLNPPMSTAEMPRGTVLYAMGLPQPGNVALFSTAAIRAITCCLREKTLPEVSVFRVRTGLRLTAIEWFDDIPPNQSWQRCEMGSLRTYEPAGGPDGDGDDNVMMSSKKQKALNAGGNCAVGLQPYDTAKLEWLASYAFAPGVTRETLLRYMRKAKFPFELDRYVADGQMHRAVDH